VTDFWRQARDNLGVMGRLPTHIAEAMIGAHLVRTARAPMPEAVFEGYIGPWRKPEGVAASA